MGGWRYVTARFTAPGVVCKDWVMKRCVLQHKFFDRSTIRVARELLGKFLVRRYRGYGSACSPQEEIAAMITEVEAYDGFRDKASHASRGKTLRNTPMFGPAGNWYVYFTYGMHWMLNMVTRERGYPAAILIRGVVLVPSLRGLGPKQSHDNVRLPPATLRSRLKAESLAMTTHINGPARLTKYFHIDKKLNAMPANRASGLWVEDRGVRIPASKIRKGPRIGVQYAGPLWATKRWRFFVG